MGTRKSDAFAGEKARISAILKEPPGDDYDSIAAWQKELQAAVQSLVKKRIEPAFNERLAAMPQATRAEKAELCRWANAELRSMGLAVRCPKTGRPAILHADLGYRPEAGCFQLELVGKEHGRHRTRTFASLIPLELMEVAPRPDPLAEYWAAKVSGKDSGGKKSR